MSTLKFSELSTDDFLRLSSEEAIAFFKNQEVNESFVESNLEKLKELIPFLLEDDAFNGMEEENGGELNFTATAKSPSERSAIIDQLLDLNRRYANDRKSQKLVSNNFKHEEERLKNLEELKKKPEEKKHTYDFVCFDYAGMSVVGIPKEQVDANGQKYLSVIPFFEEHENNTFSLLRNQDSMLVPEKAVTAIVDHQEGLTLWKAQIKKEKVDVELEVRSKLKEIVEPVVNRNLSKANFSLTKVFDQSAAQAQQILSTAGRNVGFEDVYKEIFNSIKRSDSFKLKAIGSSVYSMLQPKIENESISLKERMTSLIQTINDDNKQADFKFIENFSHKFKAGELSDNDVLELIEKYQSNNCESVSQIISEFVELKKSELSTKEAEHLQVNNVVPQVNDVVACETSDGKVMKGKLSTYEDNKVNIKLFSGEIKTFPVDEIKLTKLFKGQKYTVKELDTLLKESNIAFAWNDLSDQSKYKLLKGDTSEMLTAKHIKENSFGFKEEKNREFKLYVKNENGKPVLSTAQRNEKFSLDLFEQKGQKLTYEQKKDLKEGKTIKFTVVDNQGTLQYSASMKYDAQLNDVFVGSDIGKGFSRNMKEGVSKDFLASSKIKI